MQLACCSCCFYSCTIPTTTAAASSAAAAACAAGEYGLSKGSGKPLCYRGCLFFRYVSGVLLQSGDFINNDGSAGESIWGGTFNDENFARRHAQAGTLNPYKP